LMTSSNLLACTTRKSAGLAPLGMRRCRRKLPICFRQARSVAHQAADLGELAHILDARNRAPSR
jgi:hypothetical protein